MDDDHIMFNVGGKIYQTTRTTIDVWPMTLLGMLLRQHPDKKELFIDRDGEMFRWVLMWYRMGMLVDCTAVDVPEEVWDAELAYYGIGEHQITVAEEGGGASLGDKEPKKRKRAQQEEVLKNKAEELATRKEEQIEAATMARMERYAELLAYLLDQKAQGIGVFEFYSNTLRYPDSVDARSRVNPAWIAHWFKYEFRDYCADLGITVKIVDHFVNSKRKTFTCPPAIAISPLNIVDAAIGHSYVKMSVECG